ncbi:MAG TPA: hypothetical protein VFM18_13395 [Methanosarcina sp.]|nr:hypothetical protein [Methanosarcina sp.]
MTAFLRDEIIVMAKKSGFKASIGRADKDGKYQPDINALGSEVPVEWLERFAEHVLAERDQKIASLTAEISVLEEELAGFRKRYDIDRVNMFRRTTCLLEGIDSLLSQNKNLMTEIENMRPQGRKPSNFPGKCSAWLGKKVKWWWETAKDSQNKAADRREGKQQISEGSDEYHNK